MQTKLSARGQKALLTSTLLLTILSASCARRVVVIPGDKMVGYLPAGRTITATNDLYLVPPARMQLFLEQLSAEKKALDTAKPK